MAHLETTTDARLAMKVADKLRSAAQTTAYKLRQVQHRARLPRISASSLELVREIEAQGVATRALEELDFPSNAQLLSVLDEVAAALDEAKRDEIEYEEGFEHCTPLNPSDVAVRFPKLYLWGLDEALLDLVEVCIGTPIAYHGVIARMDLADGRRIGTRIWHRDQDDVKVIRVSIYLNDVFDREGGPFQYVPRHLTPPERALRGLGSILDEDMARVVPESRWTRCFGPKGTVIIGDVADILHCGHLPARPRKALSYYYTTAEPRKEELCRKFSFEKGVPSLRLDEPLTERQRNCLWKYAAYLPPNAG